jgi:hypothetical protein
VFEPLIGSEKRQTYFQMVRERKFTRVVNMKNAELSFCIPDMS